MSDQAARSYTHISNRAKPRDNANRKVVYRSVVDNPFRVDWPSIPVNVQNTILARVTAMADGVSEYHLQREQRSRKRKRAAAGSRRAAKKRKLMGDDATKVGSTGDATDTELTRDAARIDAAAPASEPPDVPPADDAVAEPHVLQYLTFGINEVTKMLEQLSQAFRRRITAGQPEPAAQDAGQRRRYPRLVLVCRDDIDTPILIAHLPHLVSACNSARCADGLPAHMRADVCLVPLAKGAEFALSQAMGLRRVSVMAIDSSASELAELAPLLEQIPTLRSSWLVPPVMDQKKHPIPRQIIPTHIKMLRTTAPKDMKAAKEERARGRAAAKSRRKALKAKGAIPKKVAVSAPQGEGAVGVPEGPSV